MRACGAGLGRRARRTASPFAARGEQARCAVRPASARSACQPPVRRCARPRRKPNFGPRPADRGGVGFVEGGIAGQITAYGAKLVANQLGQPPEQPLHEGIEHRVVNQPSRNTPARRQQRHHRRRRAAIPASAIGGLGLEPTMSTARSRRSGRGAGAARATAAASRPQSTPLPGAAAGVARL